MSPGFLIYDVGNPRQGPNLTTMSMSAELEIYSGEFSFLKVIRLMVKHKSETIQTLRLVFQTGSVRTCTVVSANYIHAFEKNDRVLEVSYGY